MVSMTHIMVIDNLPAGLTCLNEAAAGRSSAAFSSLTSCQAFRASHRLINPGDPHKTVRKKRNGQCYRNYFNTV